MEEWTPAVTIALIGFFSWAFMDHPVFSWYTGERNAYPMTCQKDATWIEPTWGSFLKVECPTGTKPITIPQSTFAPSREQQRVVERNSVGFPFRYDECTVYDAESWFCAYSGRDKGKFLYMTDGKLRSAALPFVFVSKATWYWYRWAKHS